MDKLTIKCNDDEIILEGTIFIHKFVCDHTTIQNLFDDFDEFNQNKIHLLINKLDVQNYIAIYSELKKIIDLNNDSSLNMNLEFYFKNIKIDIGAFIKMADYLELSCSVINNIFKVILNTYCIDIVLLNFIKRLLEIDGNLNWKDLEMCFMDINQVSEKHSEFIYNKFVIYVNQMDIDINFEKKVKNKKNAYDNSFLLLDAITKYMFDIIEQYHIKKSTNIMLYIYEFINFMGDYKIYNLVKTFKLCKLDEEIDDLDGRSDYFIKKHTINYMIYNLLFDLIRIELDSDISFNMALKQLNSIMKIKKINHRWLIDY